MYASIFAHHFQQRKGEGRSLVIVCVCAYVFLIVAIWVGLTSLDEFGYIILIPEILDMFSLEGPTISYMGRRIVWIS